jgi:formylglycine-generating enzyme required for sulfatase activity
MENKLKSGSCEAMENEEIAVDLNEDGSLVFNVKGVEFKMIRVEGGEFMMGATAEQEIYALSDERPAHRVSLDSYYIGETQVTQALWKAVMGTNVYQQRDMVDIRFEVRGDGDDYPMYYISWIDCQMFVRRLSQLTGREFRLPTEAEWEYAARGGNRSQGYRYAGGNDLNEVAWYEDNSDEKIHPVAQKLPNELGVYDMCGNVWEHCNDWYDNKYYYNSPEHNPQGAESGNAYGDSCVLRGGSWNSPMMSCRVSFRTYSEADCRRSLGHGMRLCFSLQ